jgi:hypothetical protein
MRCKLESAAQSIFEKGSISSEISCQSLASKPYPYRAIRTAVHRSFVPGMTHISEKQESVRLCIFPKNSLRCHRTSNSIRGNKKQEIESMNEISQLLQQRFGMSADQAQQAESAILDLLKSKVPPQFQGILDSVLGVSQIGNQTEAGAAAPSGELGSLLGDAESLFGAK